MIADGDRARRWSSGFPVGFVGSAESKAALADNPWDVPWLVVHGRRGGRRSAPRPSTPWPGESELSWRAGSPGSASDRATTFAHPQAVELIATPTSSPITPAPGRSIARAIADPPSGGAIEELLPIR